MKNAIVKTRYDWMALNDEWTRSGLTQKEFCRDRAVPYYGFVKARKGFLRAAAPQRKPARELAEFIPVSIEPPRDVPEIVVELPMGVTIRFRGVRTS